MNPDLNTMVTRQFCFYWCPVFAIRWYITRSLIGYRITIHPIPDVLKVFQNNSKIGAWCCLQLKMPVLIGPVDWSPLVIINELYIDGSSGINLPIEWRSIFKSVINKLYFGILAKSGGGSTQSDCKYKIRKNCKSIQNISVNSWCWLLGNPKVSWVLRRMMRKNRG